MPIDFFQALDGMHVRQSFESPSVYLDHWAIRLFSDNAALQDRFVRALKAKGGTLLLSNVGICEFAEASDARHCLDAEVFLERLLPNVYVTNLIPDTLLEKEMREPNNAERFWPPADLPELAFLVRRAEDGSLGLSMRGFISRVHDGRAGIIRQTDEISRSIIDGLEQARGDPAYVAKARRALPTDRRARTLVIYGELLRGFNLDPTATISRNDVTDLFHAALPINCCDYVLLDGPWAERVAKMRHRIVKAGIDMPIAKCFSQRADGVLDFLADLEAFVKH